MRAIITIFSTLFWSCPQVSLAASPLFEQRLGELTRRIGQVEAKLEKTTGWLRKAGESDVEVAKMFAGYIRWELANPEYTMNALDGDRRHQRRPFTKQDRQQRYREHIDYELSSSMRVLDNAEARLKQNKDWPAVRAIDWTQMKYEDGRFRTEGEVVYPAGFNMLSRKFVDVEKFPSWKEKDESLRQEFLRKMNRLGVSVIAGGINPASLIKSDGSIDDVALKRVVDHHKREGEFGSKVSVLMHWGGNREVLDALYPGIMDYRANGVYLDIDHPGVPELISKTLAGLLPKMRDLDILAWDMANEPFFDLEDWSPHSLAKYQAWLRQQHGDIGNLNHLWRANYKSYDDIPMPGGHTLELCNPAERYDRLIFHHKRVTDFFGLVADEVRKHIPDAPIHIKVQDNNSLGPRPFAVADGMDREGMNRYVTMHGLDTRPLPVTEPRMAADGYDEKLYAFHWLGQSFLYDYLGSLQPKRPIVDFEYHSMSINAIRVPRIPDGHSRATLFLAHLHGLIGNKMWYWQRRYGPGDPFPEEYFRLWFYGSLSTQPLMAAEYFHTMRELNTFAPQVDALASVHARPVRILVSEASYIHNPEHIAALHRVYEGLCFHGLPIGFVTEKSLMDHGLPEDCELLFMAEVSHLHEDAVQKLRGLQGRVRMLRYGDSNLRYGARGEVLARDQVAALNGIRRIAPTDAINLSKEFEEVLSEHTGKLEVQIAAAGKDHAFGVMQRQVQHDAKTILMLVNVSAQPQQLKLKNREGKPVKAYDLLNREEIESGRLEMALRQVRLLEISGKN